MDQMLAALAEAWSEIVQLRELLRAHGLEPVWRVLRYVASVDVLLFCLAPVLLLSWWRPARPDEPVLSRQLLADWCYPIFTIALTSAAIGVGVTAVHDLYASFLPWANLRLVDGLPFAAQFAIAFLVQDLFRWLSHWVRHKVPWLWHFHAVHHSQTVLNPATTHRAHPLEGVAGVVVTALPLGVVGGEPLAWIYAGLTGQLWDFFIHANVRTNLGPVGRVLVSPQFHRVHHSRLPEHFDRNFGDRLVVWDWLFGTMCPDRDVYPPTGVSDAPELAEVPPGAAGVGRAWLRQMAYPFRRVAASVRHRYRRQSRRRSRRQYRRRERLSSGIRTRPRTSA